MFSAIGWVWVEEAEYRDEFGDPASEPRQATRDAVRALMHRLVPEAVGLEPEAVMRIENGVHTVGINTHRNHRRTWPMELFEGIGRAAPGSFGFLHLWDDEHPTEGERFMRWTMVHGQIEVQEERALTQVVTAWLRP